MSQVTCDPAPLAEKIARLRAVAEALQGESLAFPAVFRNTARILSSVEMLERAVSDLLLLSDPPS